MRKILSLILICILFSCNKTSIETEISLSETNMKKFIEAKKNYSKKDFNLALKQINEIISDEKKFVNAYYLKGKILFFLGKVIEAKTSFSYAVSVNPFHVDSLFWLSRIASYKEKDWDNAKKYLERILLINADNIQANYNLAQLFLKMNKIPDAIMRFEKALNAEFNLPYIHLHLGMLYKKINLLDKANKHFDVITSRYKDNSELIKKLKELRQ